MDINKIILKAISKSGAINPYVFKKDKFIEIFGYDLYSEILKLTSFLNEINPTLIQRFYHIYHHIDSIKRCLTCGKALKFCGFGSGGYKTYCSKLCVDRTAANKKANATKIERYGFCTNTDKIRKTKLERYGNENYNNIEKSKQTCLEKYGVENVSQSEEVKEKIKVGNLEKYGVEHTLQVKEFRDKGKVTNLNKYGVEYTLQVKELRDKGKVTKLEKYGDENYNNMEKNRQTRLEKYGDENYNNRDKYKETNLERYGQEQTLSIQKFRDKGKVTKLEKYGDENYNNRDQFKQTNIDRYGFESFSQTPEYIEKCKETNFKRFGTPWFLQHYFENNIGQGYKNSWHDFTLPSGKIIKLQGYENKTFEFLLNEYSEDEILYERCEMPEIWYFSDKDKKTHRYFPDFYIPKDNLIIETKSKYTYDADIYINILKQKATEELGYNYKLFIYP